MTHPELAANFAVPTSTDPNNPPDIGPAILAYLNAGGSTSALSKNLIKIGAVSPDHISLRDVTNDGVPDLLIDEWHLRVLACKDGRYYQALDIPYSTEAAPILVDVVDMNLDGVPEVIVDLENIVAVDRPDTYQIFEWDGAMFQNLVKLPDTAVTAAACDPFLAYAPPCFENGGIVRHDGAGSLPPLQIADIDHNGTVELVLNAGIGYSFDAQYNGPWRVKTTIIMWNGNSFSIAKQFLEPPRYRFQALQDADHAALQGNYSEALSLYGQVISDQKLEWWSEERQAYAFYSRYPEAGTPTPTQPAPDPNEYASLAAYARFRLVVIYLLQGKSSQAESTFSDLQTHAPGGSAGQPYAQMGKAFWETYQATGDIAQACDSAAAFAMQHQSEILYYIGGPYHGFQSPIYKPRDVCPFR